MTNINEWLSLVQSTPNRREHTMSPSKNSSKCGTKGILTLGRDKGILTSPLIATGACLIFVRSRGGGTFFPALMLFFVGLA